MGMFAPKLSLDRIASSIVQIVYGAIGVPSCHRQGPRARHPRHIIIDTERRGFQIGEAVADRENTYPHPSLRVTFPKWARLPALAHLVPTASPNRTQEATKRRRANAPRPHATRSCSVVRLNAEEPGET